MKKRILALVLVLTMVLSVFPVVSATGTELSDGNVSIADAEVNKITVKLDGEDLKLTQYIDCYLANPDREYDQRIDICVPETATEDSPIIFAVWNSGWQANGWDNRKVVIADGNEYSSTANDWDGMVGRALSEGYVVVSYGCRSRNNGANEDGSYMGHSPSTMTDTKAAIRYLRENAGVVMLGNTDKIVVTGLSGGGALSTVIAASGNSQDYYESLYAVGAAGIVEQNGELVSVDGKGDDVFGVIGYCPITDFGHACYAYEWLFGDVRTELLEEYAAQQLEEGEYDVLGSAVAKWVDLEGYEEISEELAGYYGAWIAELGLKDESGNAITIDNYKDYIASLMIEEINITLETMSPEEMLADIEKDITVGGKGPNAGPATTVGVRENNGWLVFEKPENTEGYTEVKTGSHTYWYNFDLHVYYLAKYTALKVPSAFSNEGLPFKSQNEDNLFGTAEQAYSPFNAYSWNNDSIADNGVGYDDTDMKWDEYLTTEAGEYLLKQIRMTSAVEYLHEPEGADIAPNWYVRHGMDDRDTSFAVEASLFNLVENSDAVENANTGFAWFKGHAGNYDVDEAYDWLAEVVAAEKSDVSFTDVAEGDWFYEDVMYAAEKGLMNGIGNEKFDPYGTASRAMVVTVLYRIAGEPAVTGTNSFTDLTADWYKDAVQWAVENGITKGVSDTEFNPNAPVSRQEIATFLYRFANAEASKADLSKYVDADDIAAWALDAMAWANAEGLITGVDEDTLAPTADSNRAQLATILARFDKNN